MQCNVCPGHLIHQSHGRLTCDTCHRSVHIADLIVLVMMVPPPSRVAEIVKDRPWY